MVTETLSQEMIDVGRELTKRLDRSRLSITTALWLYSEDRERWRLIIASPAVSESGIRKAYQLVQSELTAAPETFRAISLGDISVVEPSNSLVSPFRGLPEITAPPLGKMLRRSTINGVYVERAFLYKLA